MFNLCEPSKGKELKVYHFPTTYQALIFRLWDMVPYSKIAQVIGSSDEEVLKSAESLGLGSQKNTEDWATRGYISILRAVWNLLPYDQIYKLLDWDIKRLSYVLKEDDFLAVKLGEKCDCPQVRYRELTEVEKIQTAKIKETVQKNIRPLELSEAAKPFDFYHCMYAPLVESKMREVVVDSSWCIDAPDCSSEIREYIDDFKSFAE